ncbi:fasciclin domain-containing protein [Nonomuraea sp. LPB2021202275-12-8]|uniref:fasciclin domain-containing protein n=1 Tax=Nonomuraea sp. LPB2021202275-12-8 TaxID=3120159 RepID=UPI00300D87D1
MKRILLAAAMTLTTTVAGTTSASALSPAPESPEGSPFGPACTALEGATSTIADQPVGTAASEVSELSTLTDALEQAGLVDQLDSAENITVFAPTNQAFEAIPKETLDKVMADKKQLTEILTYHVVKGKKTPADLEDATLTTLQGGELTAKGSGEEFTVNDAKVVCGDVPTKNATVYVIDKVLMPK